MKRYIKDRQIKACNQIVIKGQRTIKDKDGNDKVINTNIFNPTEEMILADGWEVYTPPTIEPSTTPRKKSRFEIIEELVTKQYNARTDISNEEALDYMAIIYPWDYYLDKVLTEGMIVTYEEKPWRVRQTHTPLEIYPPSLATASLYEKIDKEHDGTLEDPIPYAPPMEIFIDKYYVENNEVYKCIRNSDTALSHSLRDLIGIYVNKI